MQPLQICFGSTIRIGQESWCLPYVDFFLIFKVLDLVGVGSVINGSTLSSFNPNWLANTWLFNKILFEKVQFKERKKNISSSSS